MECAECTACCTLLPIAPIGKPVNTPCPHCDGGCSIYKTKPQTCNEFECAYIQAPSVPEALRPDICGIIFYKKTERIMVGALTGSEVTDTARRQVTDFNAQGYSVVLLSVARGKPHLMLSDGHGAEDVMSEYVGALRGNLQH